MEEYVPFEIAQKLKEKGFDKLCIYAYCEKGGWNMYKQVHEPITHILRTDSNPFGSYYIGKNWNKEYKSNKNKIRCSAPTISQVLKWLRDEKKIYIGVSYMPKIPNETGVLNDFYYPTFQKIDLFEPMFSKGGDDAYDNYEEAALAGIYFVLDNLI